jgi:hypothetical protein
MEGLIELVAASFLRHGIECPATDSAPRIQTTEPIPPTELPEHSFRKKPEADPAPQA